MEAAARQTDQFKQTEAAGILARIGRSGLGRAAGTVACAVALTSCVWEIEEDRVSAEPEAADSFQTDQAYEETHYGLIETDEDGIYTIAPFIPEMCNPLDVLSYSDEDEPMEDNSIYCVEMWKNERTFSRTEDGRGRVPRIVLAEGTRMWVKCTVNIRGKEMYVAADPDDIDGALIPTDAFWAVEDLDRPDLAIPGGADPRIQPCGTSVVGGFLADCAGDFLDDDPGCTPP